LIAIGRAEADLAGGRIVMDPSILAGKPVVRGTRVSVELVLQHLAENPDLAELLAACPRLTLDDVKACPAYAKSVVGGEYLSIDKGQRLRRSLPAR